MISPDLAPTEELHSHCREAARTVGGEAAAEKLEQPSAAGMLAPFVAAGALLALIAMAADASWPLRCGLLVLAGYCYVVIAFVGHDASHGAYCQSSWFNDAVGIWTMAHVFTAFHGFRQLHAAHHRHTGFDEDPTGDSPRHLAAMNMLTYCLFVLLPIGFPLFVILPSWLGGFGFQPHVFPAAARSKIRWNIFWVISYQAAFYGVAYWLAGPAGPIMAFIAFLIGLWITTMMNAQAHAAVETQTDCRICNTRTIESGPLVGLLTAEGGFHVEHHLLPGVPWYRLRRVHELLARHGGPRFVSRGYGDLHLSMVRRYLGLR